MQRDSLIASDEQGEGPSVFIQLFCHPPVILLTSTKWLTEAKIPSIHAIYVERGQRVFSVAGFLFVFVCSIGIFCVV